MSVQELEKKINSELHKINPKYGITKLVETAKGDYWFDFAVRFAVKDMPAVNKVLAKHIGKGGHRKEDEEIVQAKFYLPAGLCQALRELSAKTGKPQSKIVEERLSPLLH